MSKRFGRNQRRRMRESLAIAEDAATRYRAANEMNEGLAKYMRGKLDEADEYARRVAQMVGPQSIASSGIEEFDGIPGIAVRDSFRMAGRMRPIVPGTHDGSPPRNSDLRLLTLHKLKIQTVRDKLQRMTHVYATLRGYPAAYSLSDQAIDEAPRDFLIQRISEEIAQHLVGSLRGST